MNRLIALALALTLVACTAPSTRLAMAPEASALELRPLVGSVMVRTVSLPAYAAAEEVARQTADGLITSDANVLWADDPQRAATLVLTGTLGDILGIDAGPEPWPFVGLPDAAVDVRVSQMLATADGTFRMKGQFFVGGDGINFRNSTVPFDFALPMPDQSLSSIAIAQSAALVSLAEAIAARLGR